MSNFNAMSLADMSAHVTADNAKDAIAVLQARADRARNAGSAYKLAKATRAIACIEATNALDVGAVLAQAKADCGYGTAKPKASAKPKAAKPAKQAASVAKAPTMRDITGAMKGASDEQKAAVFALVSAVMDA